MENLPSDVITFEEIWQLETIEDKRSILDVFVNLLLQIREDQTSVMTTTPHYFYFEHLASTTMTNATVVKRETKTKQPVRSNISQIESSFAVSSKISQLVERRLGKALRDTVSNVGLRRNGDYNSVEDQEVDVDANIIVVDYEYQNQQYWIERDMDIVVGDNAGSDDADDDTGSDNDGDNGEDDNDSSGINEDGDDNSDDNNEYDDDISGDNNNGNNVNDSANDGNDGKQAKMNTSIEEQTTIINNETTVDEDRVNETMVMTSITNDYDYKHDDKILLNRQRTRNRTWMPSRVKREYGSRRKRCVMECFVNLFRTIKNVQNQPRMLSRVKRGYGSRKKRSVAKFFLNLFRAIGKLFARAGSGAARGGRTVVQRARTIARRVRFRGGYSPLGGGRRTGLAGIKDAAIRTARTVWYKAKAIIPTNGIGMLTMGYMTVDILKEIIEAVTADGQVIEEEMEPSWEEQQQVNMTLMEMAKKIIRLGNTLRTHMVEGPAENGSNTPTIHDSDDQLYHYIRSGINNASLAGRISSSEFRNMTYDEEKNHYIPLHQYIQVRRLLKDY